MRSAQRGSQFECGVVGLFMPPKVVSVESCPLTMSGHSKPVLVWPECAVGPLLKSREKEAGGYVTESYVWLIFCHNMKVKELCMYVCIKQCVILLSIAALTPLCSTTAHVGFWPVLAL